MDSSPAVSVVIPARNADATLKAALDAVAAQSLEHPFEVIVVVDDGSRDGTVQIAQEHPVAAQVIHCRDLGPGAKRNLGAAAAGAPVLAFTDADCAPATGWLAEGLLAIETLDIVQGTVLPTPGPFGPFDRFVSVTSEYGLYETANLFVRTSAFRRQRGFEDRFVFDERPFGEDSLFVWGARRNGARVGFAAAAVVHHAIVPRDPGDYVSEQTRRRYFPQLVRLIPELREAYLYRHWFLNARSAAFDAAFLSSLLAWRTRSPIPLALAIPYLRLLRTELLAWQDADGVPKVELAVANIAADAIGCGALALGSACARSLVL